MSEHRELTGAQAIAEATAQCMERDPSVYLLGLGAADPKGVFGTTLGLTERFPNRVLEMPVAENGMTGIAVGSAIAGLRPLMTHQRVDFALMCVEELVNNAAKWHYMFGGAMTVPLTVRMIIGRGWGQGPQHSQALHAWFMHVPGLKVVMPFSPCDAKGLLAASIRDDNPVIFIEHRWLHGIRGEVPAEYYELPLGQAKILRPGKDVTLVGLSYALIDCLKAAQWLSEKAGVEAEVIDLRTITPLDSKTVVESVKRTGRLVVTDCGYMTAGVGAEICALVAERAFASLKAAPVRVALPDAPAPTTRAQVAGYYPDWRTVCEAVARVCDGKDDVQRLRSLLSKEESKELPMVDVPDASFTGPF